MDQRPKGLLIFHGNRLEHLGELLLNHVSQNPLLAFTPDVWVVQGAGMKAWLEAQAAQHPRLGILAATRILQPAAALWDLQRLVLGTESVPSELPLDESRLIWRLMNLLEQLMSQHGHDSDGADPVWLPLLHHLQGAPKGQVQRRQYQLARQLADVFDAYQTHRPDWLRDWAKGQAQVRLMHGRVQVLQPHQQWQARLWANLVDSAKAQSGLEWVSRDQVFAAFLHALQSQSSTPAHWPERILLLGVSALPIEHIQALGALSRHIQVLVFALNPSAAYWGDARRRAHWPVQDLSCEPSAQDHPLLAAWGQQARDFLHLVDEADPHTDPRQDYFFEPLADANKASSSTATALMHLQSDILANRHPHVASDAESASRLQADGSMVFCKTHGPLREVQALHDQVLLWMAQDPSLEPRDIVVMVSDLQIYEPLVRATWGIFEPSDPRYLPFQMARPHPEQSRMLDAVQAGLELLMSPMTLGDVLSWLAHPAVSRRFGLNDGELSMLSEWLQDSGVRWGLDETHATQHGWPQDLADHNAHTWARGLERILLSQAMGDGIWQGVLTLPNVGGVAAECLNGLIRCLDTLRHHELALREPLKPQEWVTHLNTWLNDCYKPCNESQEAVLNALRESLSEWGVDCQDAAGEIPMPLSLVGLHWFEQVRSAQTGTRLITGGVVFTTAMPLQSVPFKRICLLGLSDGAFPRERTRRDFDLMDEPGWGRPGDRARHDDDRYLLLQAILSARDGLYVSWQGFQSQDGKPMPASVLVHQWLEVLHLMTGQEWPICTLPLQAHGQAYFESPAPVASYVASSVASSVATSAPTATPHLWQTHALEWQAAREQAQALIQAQQQNQTQGEPLAEAQSSPSSSPSGPAMAQANESLSVQHLLGWLRHPIDAYTRQRLGVNWQEPDPAWPDAEAFELSPLDTHQWIQSASLDQGVLERLKLSSELPAGSLGEIEFDALKDQAQVLNHHWQRLCGQSGDWQLKANFLDLDLSLEQEPDTTQPVPRIQGRLLGFQLWDTPQGLQLTQVSASRLLDPSV
ncbi:MAG: RecBCD enzyme subunit RecC, partial [Pseudomonadota bacterium]